MNKLNKVLGKLICFIIKRHRTPYQILNNRIWKVEFCNRCGHIFKKEKIGRTLNEIMNDEYRNSGNQIW